MPEDLWLALTVNANFGNERMWHAYQCSEQWISQDKWLVNLTISWPHRKSTLPIELFSKDTPGRRRLEQVHAAPWEVLVVEKGSCLHARTRATLRIDEAGCRARQRGPQHIYALTDRFSAELFHALHHGFFLLLYTRKKILIFFVALNSYFSIICSQIPVSRTLIFLCFLQFITEYSGY